MLHRVVTPFPYSGDGFTLENLKPGDERDFGAMTAGLLGEGWIEPVSVGAVAVGPIEVTAPFEMAIVTEEPIEMAIDKPRRGRHRK